MNREFERVVCNKSPLNIELVKSDPLQAIANVFESIDFDCLRTNLCRWFHAAIVNGNHVYEEDSHRKGLQVFFAELELLLEAFYVINKTPVLYTRDSYTDNETVKNRQLYLDKVYLLSSNQAEDPHAVINAFFQQVFDGLYQAGNERLAAGWNRPRRLWSNKIKPHKSAARL